MSELSINNFSVKNGAVYLNGVRSPGMLLIHAKWCPHCTRFIPVFNKLRNKLQGKFMALAIEDGELKKNLQVGKALDFQGYPTLKFFDQNGKIIGEYNGDRTEGDILSHVCKVYHHCVAYH